MTRQESFKRRIRTRMQKTGEKYGAARRALIDRESAADRGWVSVPETSEAAVREATGRGWDEWRSIIDAWPGHTDGHTAIATWLVDEHGLDGWWSQSVTVGWERITGTRLPHQMPDGTFTAGKSKIVRIDAADLRESLMDTDGREALFPDLATELRSRPGVKVPRIAIGPGVAQIAVDELGDGRARVAIAHERLPHADDVGVWKAYWADWLDAIDGA